MEVLSSRILLRPNALDRSRRFYAETLGLAVYREFGPPDHPGVVFFLGQGFLELSGSGNGSGGDGTDTGVSLWLQVRDVVAEEERLRRTGVTVLREARTEPWGLIEAWIADPDGHRIVLVQVPPGHPLRRDPR
ncbi:VOC family protein [Nonomuraea diastatica]|uniref:VOC family protein n=1 Tax=Nonomuraea diastatica TaxID=1848329 RepID=A0A4R4WBM5_9ACTN|nr:VOC family protein [Nonomuraea diastatica]TDD16258.1 VOC family protein [Nonomuraea diastatica]